MKNRIIINWFIGIVVSLYALIIFYFWSNSNSLIPEIYQKYIYKLGIYVWEKLGFWILGSIIIFFILHIMGIYKLNKKLFYSILILFFFHLLLIYLEIKQQGDS